MRVPGGPPSLLRGAHAGHLEARLRLRRPGGAGGPGRTGQLVQWLPPRRLPPLCPSSDPPDSGKGEQLTARTAARKLISRPPSSLLTYPRLLLLSNGIVETHPLHL
ncbi:unnamed protein product [Parajaminaea phylloscopi]